MGGGRGLMMGGAEGGMGTTLMRGVWIIGGMGVAMTDPGGKRTTEVIGGRGMTGTAETTAARTGGGIVGGRGTDVIGWALAGGFDADEGGGG